MDTPTTLAAAAGISVPYASQILSGSRVPTWEMAVAIYRKTGKKFGPLANLSDETVAEIAAQDAA